jgi:hypothetical protein
MKGLIKLSELLSRLGDILGELSQPNLGARVRRGAPVAAR